MLTETISKLGAVPVKITQTYQSELGKIYGFRTARSISSGLTRVLEVVALETYQKHVGNAPGGRPAVKATLEAIIDDEVGPHRLASRRSWRNTRAVRTAQKVKEAIAASGGGQQDGQ